VSLSLAMSEWFDVMFQRQQPETLLPLAKKQIFRKTDECSFPACHFLKTD